MVRRMEKSNHFHQAEIVAESVTANAGDQSAGPGNIQFDIAAVYLPNAQDTEAPATGGDEDKDKSNSQQQETAGQIVRDSGQFRDPAGSANSARAQNQPRPVREREH